MNRPPGLLPICLLVALAGCGGNEKAQPIRGPAKEVAAIVTRLESALRRRDFTVVCDQLLSAAERQQAGGDLCPRLLRQTAGDLRGPRIAIQSIQVGGGRALVKVRTSAVGQAPSPDTIRLVHERGRYRIASLGD